MWLKLAEKTDTKYIGNFLYTVVAKIIGPPHESLKKWDFFVFTVNHKI